MKTKRIGRIALALSTLLPMACASKAPAPQPAPDLATEHASAATDSKGPADAIRVFCSVYRVRRPLEDPSVCRSIDFAVEDPEGVEIARKNPDANGMIDFPVPADKPFHVVPRVSGAWTIEWIPTGDLKAGDTVRIILRK